MQTREQRVPPVELDRERLFAVIRGLVFSERKTLRGTPDLFGEELALKPDGRIAEAPLALSVDEAAQAARRVAAVFTLEDGAAAGLERLPTLGEWAEYVERHWTGSPRHICFFTSGSTGVSKTVRRRYHDLEQDAHFMAELFSGRQRLLTLAPPQHLCGFFLNIQVTRVLGIPWEDWRFRTPQALAAALRPGDLLVSMPFFLKLFADNVESVPPGVWVLTSTAPCPREIWDRLREIGVEKVVEVYGSSESGIMGYREHGDAPLTLPDPWRHVPDGGCTRWLEQGGESEEFPFEDQIDWRGEREFFVLKRHDRAVQVAGVNVFPDRVEELLRAHPAVAECSVRLMRPEEGEHLKAFVVPKERGAGGAELESGLRQCLSGKLKPIEQPKTFTFGARLPRNEMGKLTDW